ncbi:MAG TPA: CDP-alcohol phosphatidyltransferase family protein [Actinomycetota bacterium]|nr:CDP-alcohol phosphatidyltransferase family protein [Actinomycetota bacterium]
MLEKWFRPRAQKIVVPVGRALARAGFSANALTVLGFVVVLAASVVIAEGPLPLGGFLLLLGSCFDVLDGAVARVTGRVSKRGAFLDSTLDRLADGAMFAALILRFTTIHQFSWLNPAGAPTRLVFLPGAEERWGALLALAAMILGFMVSYVRARAEGLGFECSVGIAERPERVVVMALGLLLNRPVPALAILVLASAFTLVQRFLHVWKQSSAAREQRSLSPFADGAGPAAVYFAFRAAGWLAEHLPMKLADGAAHLGARVAYRFAHRKRRIVERNMARVVGEGPHLESVVRAAFRSYAEYWLETFRLGRYTADDLVQMVESVEGAVETLEEALAEGRGVMLLTPHLGFYDLGVAWIGAKGYKFSTIAEVLRPRALFEWFAGIRGRWGMKVIPALNGPAVRKKVGEAFDMGEAVAIVADRDLGRRGIWAEFFGERTTFPASPSLLAVRKKVPMIAGAMYKTETGFQLILRRVHYELSGDPVADIEAVAQTIAHYFEGLIRRAPAQWHLFSTNWPSDEEGLPPRGRGPAKQPKGERDDAVAESPTEDSPVPSEPETGALEIPESREAPAG